MFAKTSGEMETLHLLVFGSHGVISYKNYSDAVGKDIYNFTLELSEEMRPEARGLVFYTRLSDGAIIYDEFSLTPGFSVNNFVSIYFLLD